MTPPPAVLASRLDAILEAAERLLRRIPDDGLARVAPAGEGTPSDLGYALFRLSLAFIDAMDTGRLPASWLGETAPTEMRGSRALASYGALVRARLAGWVEGTGEHEYARVIEVYDGPQSGLDLFERTIGRAAQHLGQLCALAERIEVSPPSPSSVD